MTATSAPGRLDKFRLEGKNAVITGGATGIGRAIAQDFAEAGASVAVISRDTDKCREAAGQLSELGVATYHGYVDVADPASATQAVANVESDLGPIDILVNNSGIVHWGPTLEADQTAGWDQILAVNLTGVWNMSRAVGRGMVERGSGVILNMGSMSAFVVNRPQIQPSYNASKAAVHQLTKSLAVEWAPYGIRVNALACGYVATDLLSDKLQDPEFQRLWNDTPFGRPGTPDEVAPIARFLVSEASSYLTGSIVVADGGYSLW